MDTNELLYQKEIAPRIAEHVMVTKREKWWAVRNEQVEMNIHTLLFISNQSTRTPNQHCIINYMGREPKKGRVHTCA